MFSSARRRSHASSLAVFVCVASSVGCSYRVPVNPGGDASVVAAPDSAPDGTIAVPDGLLPDGPDACEKSEEVQLRVYNDPRGNFVLAVPRQLSLRAIKVANATKEMSAASIDHKGVAALAATLDTELTDPTRALAELQQRVAAKVGSARALIIRASGTVGKSADGDPDVKEAIWDLSSSSAMDIGETRDALLAAILDRKKAELGGLAGNSGTSATKLTIKLTVVLRADQIAVSAAVSTDAAYRHDATAQALTDDLGNGTALAKKGQVTVRVCDRGPITGRPTADIIWVVDESGSMNDNREDIVANANRFFAKAKAAGLDFRMGVTGMKDINKGGVPGKFCSRISGDQRDDGGSDRFLGPNEPHIFSSCVRNPPYFEGGSEYGLANAEHALRRHLPRANNSASKIRRGAELAMIIVTDEAPQELKRSGEYNGRKGFLEFQDYRSTGCEALSNARQLELDNYMQPFLRLFSGADDPEATTAVHVIGGTCKNSCKAEIPFGYKQLTEALGGQVGDVCQRDLGATLQEIINSIIASASPRVLRHRPISSTLVVEANGLPLPRSRDRGYLYNATENSLSFINVKVGKGTQIVASYRRFTSK